MSSTWIAHNWKCPRNCDGKCKTCLFVRNYHNFESGYDYTDAIKSLGQSYQKISESAWYGWTKSDKIDIQKVIYSLPCKHCSLCSSCHFVEGLRVFLESFQRLPSKREGLDKNHFCNEKNCRHCEMIMIYDLEHLAWEYGKYN
jgi:hypothetical protein